MALAQARREEIHAVVEPLDVIEPAALPPRVPVTTRLTLVVLISRQRCRGRRKP